MLKIKTMKDLERLNDEKLKERVKEILEMLNDLYGEDRNIEEEDGGYVIVMDKDEKEFDIEELGDIKNIEDLEDFTELDPAEVGEYIEYLIMTNNEFGLSIFVPK